MPVRAAAPIAIVAVLVALEIAICRSWLATGKTEGPGCTLAGEITWFAEPEGVPVAPSALQDPAVTARFAPVTAGSLGFGAAPLWLRMPITSTPGAAAACAIDFGFFEAARVELFQAAGPQVELVARSGTAVRYDDWPVKAPTLAFSVTARPATYFARVTATAAVTLHISVMSETTFAELASDRSLALGLYYGVVLIMILYNAVIFGVTRDRTYAYYVVFESAMLLMQTALDRTAFRYLWPSWPTWTQRSEQVLAAACLVAGIALTRAFLALPAHAPRLDRWLSGCGVACAIAGSAALFLTSPAFLMAFGGVLMVSFVVLAGVLLVMAQRGTPSARVFAFGWAPVVVGGVAAVASGLGAMPEAVGFVALKVGSAAEAALLALALAGRIVELRRAREQATRELLALQTAQRAALEQRVTERTLELTEALATLRVTQDRLVRRERVATLAGMVAGVAHEVGNPLNFAQGGAASLEDQLARVVRATEHGDATAPNAALTTALADARRALALIHAGHRRIGGIMNNLRGYMQARIIERKPTDLLAELEAAIEACGAPLARAKVQIERALAPLPPVACRDGELGQVFTNLIGNACRAMPDGGVLRVSSSVDADIVEIRFADSGPGVPAEYQEAIFEPFFSLRGNAAAEVQRDHIGGGLGLFICREIVSQHDGELLLIDGPAHGDVDSPRGAVFAIRLPVRAIS